MNSRIPGWLKPSTPARNELIQALHAHTGLLLKTASRILGNAADAEDVVQDIAEKLLRKPPQEVRHWPAFLKAMAVNRAIDTLRARRDTETDYAIADLPSNRPQPEEVLSENERAHMLRRALGALKHREATLFSLRYFADQSYADIAMQLDMKESAVGVALHRIRHQLADTIRQDLELAPNGGIKQ